MIELQRWKAAGPGIESPQLERWLRFFTEDWRWTELRDPNLGTAMNTLREFRLNPNLREEHRQREEFVRIQRAREHAAQQAAAQAELELKRADSERLRAERERERAERERERAEGERERANMEEAKAEREKERAEREKERAERERAEKVQERERAERAEGRLAPL